MVVEGVEKDTETPDKATPKGKKDRQKSILLHHSRRRRSLNIKMP